MFVRRAPPPDDGADARRLRLGTTVDPYVYITTHTTCNRGPKGAFDSATCAAITGWAQDPDAPTTPIDVHLYVGGPAGDPKAYGFSVKADVHRPDLCTAIGSCEHGFAARLPLGLQDGIERPVYAYAIDSKGGANTGLGSKTIKCATPTLPAGVVRRLVTDAKALESWKFAAVEIANVSDAALNGIPKGPALPPSPVLVTATGSTDVFIREYSTLRHVPSPAVMNAWELPFSAVKSVAATELANDLSGADWTQTPFLAKGSGPDVYLLDAPPPLWAELLEDDVPKSMAPGSVAEVSFRFKNRGSMTWSSVSLAPTPRDSVSELCDASWPSCVRAAALTSGVATDAETVVKLRLHAPDTEGTVTACFGLVTGAHWFSDPGSNGPADDAICRTVQITATPEAANAGADEEAIVGSCGCGMVGRRGPSAALWLVALSLVVASKRRR